MFRSHEGGETSPSTSHFPLNLTQPNFLKGIGRGHSLFHYFHKPQYDKKFVCGLNIMYIWSISFCMQHLAFFTHLFCFLPSYMSIAVTWSVYPTHSNEFLAKALFSFWLTMHPNFVTAGYKIGFNIADRVKTWSKRSCNISNLSEGKEIGWAVNLTDHLSHSLPLQRYLFWFISLLKKEHIISVSQWTCHLHIKRHSYTLSWYREASG